MAFDKQVILNFEPQALDMLQEIADKRGTNLEESISTSIGNTFQIEMYRAKGYSFYRKDNEGNYIEVKFL